MRTQRTLRRSISCRGIGLHTGQHVEMTLLPAPAHHGITFVRTDKKKSPTIRCQMDFLADSKLATSLAAGEGKYRSCISTVEHLLAALVGLEIDNVQVEVFGPEIPIMDGSAGPFVELILEAGSKVLAEQQPFIVIRKEVTVYEGNKIAKISPASHLQIACQLNFNHPLISNKRYLYTASATSFTNDLAPARTFGFVEDVEALRKKGLALGGSLNNAIVIDRHGIMNEEGLRFNDEFVRHKTLDALGDLALLGLPLLGCVELTCAGHAMNAKLVRQILEDPSCYEIRALSAAADMSHFIGLPYAPITVAEAL